MNDYRGHYLSHHGILGQKWGKLNGPPYPLGSDKSTGKRLKKQRKLDKYKQKEEKRISKYYKRAINKTEKKQKRLANNIDKQIQKGYNRYDASYREHYKFNKNYLKYVEIEQKKEKLIKEGKRQVDRIKNMNYDQMVSARNAGRDFLDQMFHM